MPEPAILPGDWIGLRKGVYQVEELLGTKVVIRKLGGNRSTRTRNILQVVKDKPGPVRVITSPERSVRYRAGSIFNIKVQGVRLGLTRTVGLGMLGSPPEH